MQQQQHLMQAQQMQHMQQMQVKHKTIKEEKKNVVKIRNEKGTSN